MSEEIADELHLKACQAQIDTYVDPITSYQVFTAHALGRLGRCCGSGCRHCPYAHAAIPLDKREQRIQQPAWLTTPARKNRRNNLLFWSGGKDSFLAYRFLQREYPLLDTILLTTFDATSRRIAHQELPLRDIINQAEILGAPLIGVPLTPGRDYMNQITRAFDLAHNVENIVFGDLHLEHIRQWREQAFGNLTRTRNLNLLFPLWRTDYSLLLHDLEQSGVRCELSAITHEALSLFDIGQLYDRKFVEALPPEIDPFGENGEFHTLVKLNHHER